MSTAAFEAECIDTHNKYRTCHGANPLKKDPKLTAMAQQWANKIAAKGKLEHSNAEGYGENVAFTSNPSPTGVEICRMWYDEIKDYDFKKPGFTGGTGHFTQVVWKGSTNVGIGIATSSKGGTYVVANYEPAGNITNKGYFKDNVGEQTGTPDVPPAPAKPSGKDMPKPGKTVSRKTETITENGVRVKKTTITTTTVTETPEGMRTSVETEIQTENLN